VSPGADCPLPAHFSPWQFHPHCGPKINGFLRATLKIPQSLNGLNDQQNSKYYGAYVNATIGFEGLANLTDKSPKSLMRMVSPSGNTTAKNLFSIISLLQREEGLELQIKTA
jgi:hypothetical protein